LFFIGSGCLILNVPLVFDNASTNVVLFADAVRNEPIICEFAYPAIVLYLPPKMELNCAALKAVLAIVLLPPPAVITFPTVF
jgi:hypothetical protein